MGATYRRRACVKSGGDLTPGQAFPAKLRHLIAAEHHARSADRSPAPGSFLPCAVQPGAGPLAYPDALLFRDGCEDREYGVTKDATGIEVLLGVAAPVDPVRVQALKVRERFEDTLPAETVERPKQENVEAALGGFLPHPQESGAVGLRARFLVHVFGHDLPALCFAELPKLAALIIDFLSFALSGGVVVAFVGTGADPEVEGGADVALRGRRSAGAGVG
jgi:hypothetical protein